MDPADVSPMKGNYRIELKGDEGGVWSLSVSDDLQIVNAKKDADTVLIAQEHDFMNLVNGILNPQLAILGNIISVQGNVRKALLLQNLLSPAGE